MYELFEMSNIEIEEIVEEIPELTEEEKNYDGLMRLKDKRSKLPAITHVNYSGRIQTVIIF